MTPGPKPCCFGPRLVVALVALGYSSAAAGCRPLLPTRTAAEHRAEARAFVLAGSGRDAHREYQLAVAAGDESALIEELEAIDGGSEIIRGLYASASASLAVALGLVVAGTALVFPASRASGMPHPGS
jgi:hypothetical protein